MIRRPPRSTRTDTLFPYTTLFRSSHANRVPPQPHSRTSKDRPPMKKLLALAALASLAAAPVHADTWKDLKNSAKQQASDRAAERSEERRVGKECVSTGRSRGSPYHSKTKQNRENTYTKKTLHS